MPLTHSSRNELQHASRYTEETQGTDYAHIQDDNEAQTAKKEAKIAQNAFRDAKAKLHHEKTSVQKSSREVREGLVRAAQEAQKENESAQEQAILAKKMASSEIHLIL